MPGGIRKGFTEEVTFEEEEKYTLRGQREQQLLSSICTAIIILRNNTQLFYFTCLRHCGCEIFFPYCVHTGSVC